VKTINDIRITVEPSEIAGITLDRYHGALVINLRDGGSASLATNDPERFKREIITFVRGFKYGDPNQETLDLLASMIEAATDATRVLQDKATTLEEAAV
jgi:hypothetical protein